VVNHSTCPPSPELLHSHPAYETSPDPFLKLLTLYQALLLCPYKESHRTSHRVGFR
jgi:hypothetical protein